MKKYFDILRSCPLFFGISDEETEKMLVCLGAKVEKFDRKYTVISEGSSARFLGIVLSGSVQIIRNDYYGNRNIITNVGVSHLFCEAFACSDIESMPVSVVANEPTVVMLIDSAKILHTCANNCSFHQKLIFNLMKSLATKTITLHQKQEITSCRSTREKLMTYLLLEAKKQKRSKFFIPFDRQELADYLEVERSGLSAEISKLQKQGVLKTKKSYFELL